MTVGVLRTAGGDVQPTWPDQVPLGRPFKAREPVWTWGIGAGLLDGDGIAVGAPAVSLLLDGFPVAGRGLFRQRAPASAARPDLTRGRLAAPFQPAGVRAGVGAASWPQEALRPMAVSWASDCGITAM